MLWNEPFSLLNSELRLIYRLNYWIKLKLLNKAQLRKTPPDSRSLSCEHGARVLESNSDACSVLVFFTCLGVAFCFFPYLILIQSLQFPNWCTNHRQSSVSKSAVARSSACKVQLLLQLCFCCSSCFCSDLPLSKSPQMLELGRFVFCRVPAVLPAGPFLHSRWQHSMWATGKGQNG